MHGWVATPTTDKIGAVGNATQQASKPGDPEFVRVPFLLLDEITTYLGWQGRVR
jgi:hypothetical protein